MANIVNGFKMRNVTIAVSLTAIAAMLVLVLVFGDVLTPAPTPTLNCVIKGNISIAGEKIYHVPGQVFYTATVISPSHGERWFCSESDALAAGWRRADQ